MKKSGKVLQSFLKHGLKFANLQCSVIQITIAWMTNQKQKIIFKILSKIPWNIYGKHIYLDQNYNEFLQKYISFVIFWLTTCSKLWYISHHQANNRKHNYYQHYREMAVFLHFLNLLLLLFFAILSKQTDEKHSIFFKKASLIQLSKMTYTNNNKVWGKGIPSN